ncbi:MAG: acylneuraminate cytidylyltransferase family protein [Bacteroidota bacterium]
MRILGLIPARGGSKGILRKNIKRLHGKELIRYSIEAGLRCGFLDTVLVSTDDEEIAAVSRRAGAEVPFLRPAALASDASPTIDTVIHALRFMEERQDYFDAICLLQPTVPFRDQTDLDHAIQHFMTSDADSLISVREVPHVYNPYWVYEQDNESGFLKLAKAMKSVIPRRQDLPTTYHRDGSVYLVKKEIVLTNRSLYGNKITHYVMQHSPNINIDTTDDWNKAEKYASENFESANE